jgi:hypothetical protein
LKAAYTNGLTTGNPITTKNDEHCRPFFHRAHLPALCVDAVAIHFFRTTLMADMELEVCWSDAER